MNNKKALVLDTDIGTNPDDFFALLLSLNAKEFDLKLVITGNKYPIQRALLASKILKNANRRDIPVCVGEETGCVEFYAQEYIEGYSQDVLSNHYLDILKKIIDKENHVTYVTIQGCSNIAKFLQLYPTYKDKIEVIHMGMTTKNAKEDYIKGGTNMEADQLSAKYIYESGVSLKVIGSHTTINDALRVYPGIELYKKIELSNHPNHKMLFSHLCDYNERTHIWPALHDPFTVAVAAGKNFVEFEKINVDFNSDGLYKIGSGNTIITISRPESKSADFMKYCTENI